MSAFATSLVLKSSRATIFAVQQQHSISTSMALSSDAYGALRIKEFRRILVTRFCITLAIQIQYVALGWQVYAVTHDPLALGLSGLAEALPYISMSLISGYVADHYNRKRVFQTAVMVLLAASIGLFLYGMQPESVLRAQGVGPFYIVAAVVGLARAFMAPTMNALWGQWVPRELYANGATWNANNFNVAAITGPALGGLIYGFYGAKVAYACVIAFIVIAIGVISTIPSRPVPVQENADESLKDKLTAGLRFVFKNQVLVGGMSLDMFAVLFGGTVSMLPVIAHDVLHTGPEGMGILRSATAAGSVLMGLVVAFRPPHRNTGRILLWCVAGYGACIIAFAFSRDYWLSFALLMMSGAFDNVSMVIRGSIAQLLTPDAMRGRVAAVNGIFIGSSNEIGSFESGVAARLLGLIPSIIFGGSMTLLVVAITSKIAPKLRRFQIEEDHA